MDVTEEYVHGLRKISLMRFVHVREDAVQFLAGSLAGAGGETESGFLFPLLQLLPDGIREFLQGGPEGMHAHAPQIRVHRGRNDFHYGNRGSGQLVP